VRVNREAEQFARRSLHMKNKTGIRGVGRAYRCPAAT